MLLVGEYYLVLILPPQVGWDCRSILQDCDHSGEVCEASSAIAYIDSFAPGLQRPLGGSWVWSVRQCRAQL